MRANAAVWLFMFALTGGMILYGRKLSQNPGGAAIIHRGLKEIIPALRPGQTLHLITDYDGAQTFMHARLALAPCNLFSAKATDKPDTVLVISQGDPAGFGRRDYVPHKTVSEGALRFMLFSKRP